MASKLHFNNSHGLMVRWSATETDRAPLWFEPDLSECRMASPMDFCTIFFMGRAEGFVNAVGRGTQRLVGNREIETALQ